MIKSDFKIIKILKTDKFSQTCRIPNKLLTRTLNVIGKIAELSSSTIIVCKHIAWLYKVPAVGTGSTIAN